MELANTCDALAIQWGRGREQPFLAQLAAIRQQVEAVRASASPASEAQAVPLMDQILVSHDGTILFKCSSNHLLGNNAHADRNGAR